MGMFESTYTEKKLTSLAVYLSVKYERLEQKNVTSIGLVILYCHLSGKVQQNFEVNPRTGIEGAEGE
jgi:hypothetical protein